MKDKTATPIIDVVRSQMQADDATDYRAMLERQQHGAHERPAQWVDRTDYERVVSAAESANDW